MVTAPANALEAPVVDWVDPQELLADPYPTYERLRNEAPVAYVPNLGRYFVTTFQDCFDVEMNAETFSSHEAAERSTMIRTMGRPMIRLDGEQHKTERKAAGHALRPIVLKKHWNAIFQANAEKYLADVVAAGPGADFFNLFAVPYAADNLSAVIGFRDVPAAQMMDWSHTFIAGISNVTQDPAVWAETERVCLEIDDAIDEAINRLEHEPDASMISAMLGMGLDEERLRANIRLTISGGMNEPSHILSSAVWCLSEFPQQRERVLSGESSWRDVFEETARFHSPVGMYPRRTTKDAVIGGVAIPAGSTVAVVGASANRDDEKFSAANQFDLTRESAAHLAFGNGAHICLGNWVARAMVGDIALPYLYENLPGLRVIDTAATDFRGWVFRGTRSLYVEWDAA